MGCSALTAHAGTLPHNAAARVYQRVMEALMGRLGIRVSASDRAGVNGGTPHSPEIAAAVSHAGGIGSLGCAYLSAG